MFLHKLLVYCVCLIQILCAVLGQFNYSAYEILPTIFTLDDYERCMNTHEQRGNNTYCIVYAEIIPNETSPLWQHIENYSRDYKNHYRHSNLFKGVCLERCRELLQTLSAQQVKELYFGKPKDEDLNAYLLDVYKNEAANYEELLGSCLNYEFQKAYALSLRTSGVYCERNDTPFEFDSLDRIFVIIVVVIILLNILSSWYDYKLKCAQPFVGQDRNYYSKDCESLAPRLLTTFSICRNYYRLIKRQQSDTAKDLRFFDGFRVICVALIITAHLTFIGTGLPVQNFDFVERYFHSMESILLLNGTAVIQIFFVISGFLLFLHFSKAAYIGEKSRCIDCIAFFVKMVIYRFLKFLPSLLFIILFSSSVQIHLQDGPIWRLSTLQSERVFCRKDWWKNLIYINNFSMKFSCCLHTWYLAADMQLFEIYLIVLILAARFPKYRKAIYTAMLILAFAVPAFLTYFQELDGNFHMQPENYRYFYFKDADAFFKSYVPFYMNLGGYIFGILCAELYVKVKASVDTKSYQGKLRYEMAWWLALPALLAIILTGTILRNTDIAKPSLWLAIYAALYRNLWVAISSCLIIGMLYKVGGLGYQFLRLPLFNILSKISFQAYLWHVSVIRLHASFNRQPLYFNRLVLIQYTISTYIMTIFIAFVVCLTLQYPFGECVKIMFNRRTRTTVENNNTKQEVFTIKDTNFANIVNKSNIEIPK